MTPHTESAAATLKAPRPQARVRRERDFDLYSLDNGVVEVVAVPQLGARIIALKNVRTRRDWLWHPGGGLTLFENCAGDDFSQSPLAGIDECFPTIAPCVWRGRVLPDHGELWSAAWEVDAAAWAMGELKTRLRLAVSPFAFERTLRLAGNEVRLDYALTNLSGVEENFLWAIHPLLRLQPGDRLKLPASTRTQLNGATWVDEIDAAVPERRCAKVFAAAVVEGRAAIQNAGTGEGLEFSWNPAQNEVLGLWLTRGGWHGHDHFAIEPANGDQDCLATAVERNACGTIAAHGTLDWQIRLRISDQT
jgi:galactose mutarotase-like enzyme